MTFLDSAVQWFFLVYSSCRLRGVARLLKAVVLGERALFDRPQDVFLIKKCRLIDTDKSKF